MAKIKINYFHKGQITDENSLLKLLVILKQERDNAEQIKLESKRNVENCRKEYQECGGELRGFQKSLGSVVYKYIASNYYYNSAKKDLEELEIQCEENADFLLETVNCAALVEEKEEGYRQATRAYNEMCIYIAKLQEDVVQEDFARLAKGEGGSLLEEYSVSLQKYIQATRDVPNLVKEIIKCRVYHDMGDAGKNTWNNNANSPIEGFNKGIEDLKTLRKKIHEKLQSYYSLLPKKIAEAELIYINSAMLYDEAQSKVNFIDGLLDKLEYDRNIALVEGEHCFKLSPNIVDSNYEDGDHNLSTEEYCYKYNNLRDVTYPDNDDGLSSDTELPSLESPLVEPKDESITQPPLRKKTKFSFKPKELNSCKLTLFKASDSNEEGDSNNLEIPTQLDNVEILVQLDSSNENNSTSLHKKRKADSENGCPNSSEKKAALALKYQIDDPIKLDFGDEVPEVSDCINLLGNDGSL